MSCSHEELEERISALEKTAREKTHDCREPGWLIVAIQQLLAQMEGRLSKKLEDMADDLQSLVDATSALSTAADAQSVKTDKVVGDFEKLLAALAGAGNTLTPAAVAARDAAKKSVASLATAGDALDAEIAKVDAVLPTPAPAAPPVI